MTQLPNEFLMTSQRKQGMNLVLLFPTCKFASNDTKIRPLCPRKPDVVGGVSNKWIEVYERLLSNYQESQKARKSKEDRGGNCQGNCQRIEQEATRISSQEATSSYPRKLSACLRKSSGRPRK